MTSERLDVVPDNLTGDRPVDRTVTSTLDVGVTVARPQRILVVEDDPDQARGLELALSDAGYDVMLAPRGEEAIVCARAAPPDLALVDVRLPDRDGFTVARDLAAQSVTASMPILFVSASDDLPERVRRCLMKDVDFLNKPYKLEELLARIDRCLSLAKASTTLRQEARLDELTGLGNLRLLKEMLAIEWSRIDRYRSILSIAFLDLDGLKAVNDRYGHQTGSAVIQAVGQALRAEVRETDFAARYGGDEFVALLPHTDLGQGIAFAERLLARVRHLRPCSLSVAASIGIAAFDGRIDRSAECLLSRADAALYRAKNLGGNRVEHAQASIPSSSPKFHGH